MDKEKWIETSKDLIPYLEKISEIAQKNEVNLSVYAKKDGGVSAYNVAKHDCTDPNYDIARDGKNGEFYIMEDYKHIYTDV